MARSRLDSIPADLAELSAFRQRLRRRKHFGSDVEHDSDVLLANSDSVLLYGGTSGNRASARFYVVDCCFYTFDCATSTRARTTTLTISATGRRKTARIAKEKTKRETMILPLLAEMSGSIHVGLAAMGAGIGVGLTGLGAAAAVGRNPGAATPILVQAILAIAFTEAIVFYALFLLAH